MGAFEYVALDESGLVGRRRIEQALSGLAESQDVRRNMQLYAALGAALFGAGAAIITSTNAIHLYPDLDDTAVVAWVLKPPG